MYGTTTDSARQLVAALAPITQALQTLTQSLTAAGGGPRVPVQAAVQQSPLQGSPVQQTPLQGSPVQQSPVQSGPPMKGAPPMKVTQGGGPSAQYVPMPVTPKQYVLIPRPQPRVELEEPKRRRSNRGGGGGATQTKPDPPTSRIQAQQNRGGSIVNRESRDMPANYRNETSDRGKHGRTNPQNDPGGAKRGKVSAQTNRGSIGKKKSGGDD